ncbi:MAG: hypothetical protein L0211_12540, partial [Planctomycetaceae bacterium]|nr:hypothetical protein [Planctomycetaceae bacterium]
MHVSLTLVVWALLGQVETSADAPNSSDEQAQQSAERVLALATQYEFYAEASRKMKLILQDKPVLTYSNPVRGDVYGDVFVWTREGRPEVVAAIFDYRTNKWIDSELHMLAGGGTVGVRDDRIFWQPDKPGTRFQPIPAAAAPAATAAKRLSQMRSMAREFSVERNHPEQGKDSLRILSQPIFRYASPALDIVDGAMFVFVEGTDPEAFLLIEATGKEKPTWQFAFARMNIVEFDG